jgi:hypothetical protein
MSAELAEVARLMVEHRLDSVEMPSGLKVLKTTHAPFLESAPPEVVEEAVARRLEALGVLNASEETGRVPAGQEGEDELLFAASRAPAIRIEDFASQGEPPAETEETPDE